MINPNPRVHLGSVPVKVIGPVTFFVSAIPIGTCGVIEEWGEGVRDGEVLVEFSNKKTGWVRTEHLAVISWSEYHS